MKVNNYYKKFYLPEYYLCPGQPLAPERSLQLNYPSLTEAVTGQAVVTGQTGQAASGVVAQSGQGVSVAGLLHMFSSFAL